MKTISSEIFGAPHGALVTTLVPSRTLWPPLEIDRDDNFQGRRRIRNIGTGGTLWVAARFSEPVDRILDQPMFQLEADRVSPKNLDNNLAKPCLPSNLTDATECLGVPAAVADQLKLTSDVFYKTDGTGCLYDVFPLPGMPIHEIEDVPRQEITDQGLEREVVWVTKIQIPDNESFDGEWEVTG